MADLRTFRVHFEDGETVDVRAVHPDDARDQASQRHSGRIRKVKVVRDGAS